MNRTFMSLPVCESTYNLQRDSRTSFPLGMGVLLPIRAE